MDPASLLVIALIIYFVIKTLMIKKRKDDSPSLSERFAERKAAFDKSMEESRKNAEAFAKNWLPGKTLEDYRKAHPESFDPKGQFMSCHHCGGRTLFLRSRYGYQAHLCKQCGSDLWHSISVI